MSQLGMELFCIEKFSRWGGREGRASRYTGGSYSLVFVFLPLLWIARVYM